MRRVRITLRIALAFATLAFCLDVPLFAQDSIHLAPNAAISIEPDPVPNLQVYPMRPVSAKWHNFVQETLAPITVGAGAFNAVFSQVTHADPQYGTGGTAFAKRYGASVADIVSQNFFGDFLIASAFHEDPHYHRMGPGRSIRYRTGYAISRAFVIRKDTVGNTFNFDNIFGSALSAGFSNLYYPAPSRTRNAILSHFVIDIADNGFVNLAPEFWPDFRNRVFRRHHSAQPR